MEFKFMKLTSLRVLHSLVCGWDPISVDTVLGVLGDVGQDDLVWISLDELVLAVGVWLDATHDLGIGVFELGMSSEFLSLLLVSV
jgi:hypothetical protein